MTQKVEEEKKDAKEEDKNGGGGNAGGFLVPPLEAPSPGRGTTSSSWPPARRSRRRRSRIVLIWNCVRARSGASSVGGPAGGSAPADCDTGTAASSRARFFGVVLGVVPRLLLYLKLGMIGRRRFSSSECSRFSAGGFARCRKLFRAAVTMAIDMATPRIYRTPLCRIQPNVPMEPSKGCPLIAGVRLLRPTTFWANFAQGCPLIAGVRLDPPVRLLRGGVYPF